MVKRADVAALAGVSPAVVSYVLNGGPRHVSEATRARVLSAVKELGYTPNALAAGLRRGTSRTIGIVMPSPLNPYLAELADLIEEQTAKMGYSVQFSISRDIEDRDVASIQGLLDRQVDGLIVLSSFAFQTLQSMGSSHPPVVVIDHLAERASVSSVHVDNEFESRRAVEYLQSLGHKNIVCLSGPEHVSTSNERISGWRSAQHSAGLDDSEALVFRAPYTPQGGWEAANQILNIKKQKPTAVFVASDAQAQGLLAALSDRGVSVPGQLSIISFDGSAASRFTSPPLTVIKQPAEEIVEKALGELFKKMSDPDSKPIHLVARCELIERGSATKRV